MPIYFIRHGQSEFNVVHQAGKKDPMIFDAPLTDRGREQAKNARRKVAELGIRHVITSPLTRAVQTALTIFADTTPIKVSAAHREWLLHSCDVGRPPSELQRDFPDLSFAHLDDIWWHQGAANGDGIAEEPNEVFFDRLTAFATSLTKITDRPVAIVGHGNVFRAMTGHMMENCEVHKYEANDSPPRNAFIRF